MGNIGSFVMRTLALGNDNIKQESRGHVWATEPEPRLRKHNFLWMR